MNINVTKNKKKCTECTVLFQPNSNSQKTCSKICKDLRTKRISKPREYSLNCAECNKDFTNKYSDRKFCSDVCLNLSKNKPNVNCSNCGVHFHLKPYLLKRTNNPCCGKKCSNEFRRIKGWEEYLSLNDNCVVCGANKPIKFSYSNTKKNKTCSKTCKYIFQTTDPNNYKKVLYKFNDKNYQELHRYVHNKISSLKKRAKDKKLKFDIDTPWLLYIIPPNRMCPVLNIPMIFKKQNIKDIAASIDRIDNSKGYTKDNVCWMSYKANRLKNEMKIDEVKKILEFLKFCEIEKNYPEMFGSMFIGKPFKNEEINYEH